MNAKCLCLLLLLCLTASALPGAAQDVGRVSPAALPIPLPTPAPLPPDQLRAHNPWVLPMTGTWKFALTHGRITAGRFQSSQSGANGITASSNEDKNPPENAFDGSDDTRWCAGDSSYPQWLQADLRQTRHVTGITLTWEKPGDTYSCRLEGGADGKHWKTLADESAAPGVGSGPVTITPADVRYVRITVLGNSGTDWASLREFQIRTTEGGQETAWRPTADKAAAPPASTRDAFAAPNFDDADWDRIAVPSNWEMLGYSLPTYNSVDNTVGLYRRFVTVPAAWAGRRIVWRFDGALDGAEVFVNGQKAGYHESGYTAWDIDLTGLVKPGRRNLFAVRVSKTTPSDDCETGDFQAMGGIYRETSLIAVPQTHASEVTVRTPLAANYRDATLAATVSVRGTPGEAVALTGHLFRANGEATAVSLAGAGRIGANGSATVALSAPVKAPKLWSAEKPSLYTLVVELTSGGQPGERIEQRFGFKQIEIKNNVVLWNGRPIKCTGVCRHDFWASKGFALSDAQWVRDLSLMKAANVNAIRTSHYNHAARFLELCEEKGVYVLDEVPFCWIGDQVKDPKYAPFLLQRAQETLARDKNRPCVLAWSIGNENGFGADEQQVMDLVKKTDPTRPAFVSQQNPSDIKRQDLGDAHYPDPGSVDWDATHNAALWPVNYSEHPHIFYQKDTQDYDPGASDLWSEALMKTWDKLWKAPTILGSFIWEWQNQGIADKNPDKTRDFYYGPDRLRQENNKGIVSAYRVPKPEWWIVKSVYSPVVVGTRTVSPSGGVCTVPLTNHYSFTDLKELACRWTAYGVPPAPNNGGVRLGGAGPGSLPTPPLLGAGGTRVLAHGVLHVPCAPMQTVQASFPAPAGLTTLRLEFDHPDGTSVVAANLALDGAPPLAAPTAMADGGALTTQGGADTLAVSNAVQQITFDRHTGALQSWRVGGRDLLVGSPVLNLGEAKASGEKGFYRAAQPPVTDAAQVTVSPATVDGVVRVTTTDRVLSAAGGTPLGTLTCTYDVLPDAEVRVGWTLDWTAPDTRLWEEGLKLTTPAAMTRMAWSRDSFFTDYPTGHLGEPTGTSRAGDVSFRASKRSLHWLTLTDTTGAGLALLPQDLPLTARADPGLTGVTLFASREVAGPQDFSGSWVSEHDIHAAKGKPLTGAFALRAIAPSNARNAQAQGF